MVSNVLMVLVLKRPPQCICFKMQQVGTVNNVNLLEGIGNLNEKESKRNVKLGIRRNSYSILIYICWTTRFFPKLFP